MTHLIPIGPLLFESGDRLSREEFLKRWECAPGLKKAELIDGVVYLPSPVSLPHGSFDTIIQMVLNNYAANTPGCEPFSNTTWLMLESAPQPDSSLCWVPATGKIETTKDLATGAPELVIEIAVSRRSYDLGPKLALYQKAGVQEFVAVLIEEECIEWRVLESGSYRLMQADTAGIFRSKVFPGLWIDSAALWRRDRGQLLAVLEQGVQAR